MERQKDTSDQEQSDRSKQSSQRNGSNREQSASNAWESPIGSLHHSVGNQAVQRLYQEGYLQAKLSVSQPRDDDEQVAERVAKQVMRMSATEHQVDPRSAGGLNRKGSSNGRAIAGKAKKQIESLKGGGKSLPPAARSFFEPRFGQDFGDVQIHTGTEADKAARSINADAFTNGKDVVFRKGQYDPSSKEGKRLLAHELTHVVQQNESAENMSRLKGKQHLSNAKDKIQRQSEDKGSENEGQGYDGTFLAEEVGLEDVVDRKEVYKKAIVDLERKIEKVNSMTQKWKGMRKIAKEKLVEYEEYAARKRSQSLGMLGVTPGPVTFTIFETIGRQIDKWLKSGEIGQTALGVGFVGGAPTWIIPGVAFGAAADVTYSWYKRMEDIFVTQAGELENEELRHLQKVDKKSPEIINNLEKTLESLKRGKNRFEQRVKELEEREEELRSKID